MSNSTEGVQIDDHVGALETAVGDILGIPMDTQIFAAMFSADAAGLKKVILQSLGSDPAVAGEFVRNGAGLLFHDGTAARRLLDTLLQIQRVKTANQLASGTTTLANVDDLLIPLLANVNYMIEALLFWTVDSASSGLDVAFTVPAGSTLLYSSLGPRSTTYNHEAMQEAPDEASFGGSLSIVNTAWLKGVISVGGSAGNLQMQFAQNIATGTTTLMAGSILRAQACLG